MKKISFLSSLLSLTVGVQLLAAQTIDFELLPDGSVPPDRMVISNQYAAMFGVSFRFEDGSYPQIAHVGPPRTAFGGPPNHRSADEPAPGQDVRTCFLTDDGVVLDPPAALLVD